MPIGWRLLKSQRTGSAFSGEGARRWRGRWNSKGTPIVYLSEHQSLAALEVFVQMRPLSPADDFAIISAEWEPDLMETLSAPALPKNWRALPPGMETAAIGDRWVREGRSAVLAVPSAIIPAETNFLINPAHPDFRRIRIRKPARFEFDPRMLQR
jgi:RES domain-containing protein